MRAFLKGLAAGVALLAIATVVQSAPAKAPGADKRQCFHGSTVNSFRAPDRDTVYVRVGVRDVYKLDLFAPCPEVKWTETIGLRSRGSEWICDGLDVELLVRQPGGIGPQRCLVRDVHKLSTEEVAALPKGAKP